jgi:hypothetical protein
MWGNKVETCGNENYAKRVDHEEKRVEHIEL